MKPAKFILIDTGSESNRIMLSDVGRMENGIQRTKTYETGSKLLDNLIRLHFSYTVTQVVNLPGKSIWNKYCILEKLTQDRSFEYYIVIVNNAIHRLSIKYLNIFREKENVHIYSLILDPFEHLPRNVQKQLMAVQWDRIFSFQRSDCEKYRFEFTDMIYSKVDIAKYSVPSDPESDVYFIGLAKDRLEKVYSVYKKLSISGCRCDFTVIVGKDKLQEYKSKYPGIEFQVNRISYDDILRKIAATKCILEICAEGQDGLTMRFYEALFYNKMLISNNQSTKLNSYYQPKYMQIWDEPDEIDTERVLRENTPDYHYKGEFSPVNFMRQIVDCQNSKEM